MRMLELSGGHCQQFVRRRYPFGFRFAEFFADSRNFLSQLLIGDAADGLPDRRPFSLLKKQWQIFQLVIVQSHRKHSVRRISRPVSDLLDAHFRFCAANRTNKKLARHLRVEFFDVAVGVAEIIAQNRVADFPCAV